MNWSDPPQIVALNSETYARDLQEVSSGGYFLYDSTWPRPALLQMRDDVTVLGALEVGRTAPVVAAPPARVDGHRRRLLVTVNG